MRLVIISALALTIAISVNLALADSTDSRPFVVRWEYRVMSANRIFEAKDFGPADGIFESKAEEYAYFSRCLNELGDDGWELVTVADVGYIFKRRVASEGT